MGRAPGYPPRTRPSARLGLTLTEVLVALVLTSLVIMGTWRFFATASDTMSVFTGVSVVDERLAFAADLLASDARRAGMFGTPHSQHDPLVCPKPARQLRAVTVLDGQGLPGFAGLQHNPHVSPDVCIFQAPVLTHLLNPRSISGSLITLDAADPRIPGTADGFERLFRDRLLRITSPAGFHQFVSVTGLDFDARTVTVTPSPTLLEDNGVCGVEGLGGPDHEIAVLTHIRYQLLPDPEDPDEDTLLVREELNPELTAVLPGTRLVVAENIVDLQCWGERDGGSALTGSDFESQSSLGDDQGTADLTATSAETQRLRILHFTLAGRTDREYATHSHQPKAGAYDLLSTWEVDPNSDGVALALTVGQRVEVSSLVVRRLR